MGAGNDADNSNGADDGRATSLGRIIVIIAAVDATNNMGAVEVVVLLLIFGNDADSELQ